MANQSPGCFGGYDFDRITHFAIKRFVEGNDTINLLKQAQSQIEREEIALVCMLDIDNKVVMNIRLDCKYAEDCKVRNCRDKLRNLLETQFKVTK